MFERLVEQARRVQPLGTFDRLFEGQRIAQRAIIESRVCPIEKREMLRHLCLSLVDGVDIGALGYRVIELDDQTFTIFGWCRSVVCKPTHFGPDFSRSPELPDSFGVLPLFGISERQVVGESHDRCGGSGSQVAATDDAHRC
ncbi:hypothetical protein GALL_480300 [mine drainage metagenome]|uniref:Uncharacterized protein n=1 Tax=mine drainage metagenome TaxID=410659 RepID=A0A1J5PG23_9ZZZZ